MGRGLFPARSDCFPLGTWRGTDRFRRAGDACWAWRQPCGRQTPSPVRERWVNARTHTESRPAKGALGRAGVWIDRRVIQGSRRSPPRVHTGYAGSHPGLWECRPTGLATVACGGLGDIGTRLLNELIALFRRPNQRSDLRLDLGVGFAYVLEQVPGESRKMTNTRRISGSVRLSRFVCFHSSLRR